MSSLVIAMRRGRAAAFRQRVLMKLPSSSDRCCLPCCSRTRRRRSCLSNSTPCRRGAHLAVGGVSSLISPVFGSRRPIRLSVLHREPQDAAPCRRSAYADRPASGVGYSVTAPVFGSSLPINDPVFPVYQMLPSRSSCRPCGPECAVLSGNSLISPVFGSTPAEHIGQLARCTRASRRLRANGSCGRDPGVGACHSLNEISAGPGITTPSGLPFSGKLLIKYALSGSDLIRRQRSALIDHHPQHGVPAVRRVARADAAQQGVADVAVGLGQFLAGSVGQLLAPSQEARSRAALPSKPRMIFWT